MNDTKHTPTPWMVSQTGSYFTEIRAEGGRRISETWVQGQARSRDAAIKQAYTNEANAAHIVKCVNMHEELVDRFSSLFNWLMKFNGEKDHKENTDEEDDADFKMLMRCQETLKKAGAL